MPPAAANKVLTYDEQERVLCFHGPMLYEAKVLSIQKPENKGDNPLYKVHYKGWKNTWDEFVPADRLRKMNEENLRLQRELVENAKPAKKTAATSSRKSLGGATGKAGSEDPPATAPRAGPKRGRELEIEKEEDYLKRHDVKIFIPDSIKAILVDDWENVTKNQMLVPLPKDPNVVNILEAYRKAVPKKKPGSAEADIFDEVIAGLKLYFDKSLGTILLYRFERQQFLDITKEHPGKQPSEIYGAEHMLRLCVSMPELLAHTNMDSQAMSKLRDHIEEFVRFLSKHPEYISNPYESGEAYRRVFVLNDSTGELEAQVTPYPGVRPRGRAATTAPKPKAAAKSKETAKKPGPVPKEKKAAAKTGASETPASGRSSVAKTPAPVDDTPAAAPKRRGRAPKDTPMPDASPAPSSTTGTPAPSAVPKRLGRPKKNPVPASSTPEPADPSAATKEVGGKGNKRKADSSTGGEATPVVKKAKATPLPKKSTFAVPTTPATGRMTRRATRAATRASATPTPTPAPAPATTHPANVPGLSAAGTSDTDEDMPDAASESTATIEDEAAAASAAVEASS